MFRSTSNKTSPMQARPFLEAQALARTVRDGLAALTRVRDAAVVPELTVRWAMELEPQIARCGVTISTLDAAHNLAVAMVLTVAPRLIFDEFCPQARREDLLRLARQHVEERDAEGWTPSERAVQEEAQALVRAYCDVDWVGMNDDAFVEAGRWWQRLNPARAAAARAVAGMPPSPQ